MKGLKKIALVAAIAAAPFAANAELQAMNDTAMGDVTGQAGVTIELETKVSIGQFKYTDEGSFAVNDIVLGGAGVTVDGDAAGYNTLLDQLKIDIDIADDGDAIIHVGSLQTDPATGAPAPIDWGITVGSMELLAGGTGSDSTTLISNLSGYGNLAQLDIQVDTATDRLNLVAAFDVTDMDFDVEFLGVGIRDLAITGAGADAEAQAMYAANGVDLPAMSPLEQAIFTQYANVNLDIYKGNGLGDSTATDVLRIDVNNVFMDITIGAVEIGGTSIGSLAIDNLAVTDTRLAVYGKD